MHEESIQLPQGIRPEDLEQKLIESFAEYFGVEIIREAIDPRILSDAYRLAPDCLIRDSYTQDA